MIFKRVHVARIFTLPVFSYFFSEACARACHNRNAGQSVGGSLNNSRPFPTMFTRDVCDLSEIMQFSISKRYVWRLVFFPACTRRYMAAQSLRMSEKSTNILVIFVFSIDAIRPLSHEDTNKPEKCYVCTVALPSKHVDVKKKKDNSS